MPHIYHRVPDRVEGKTIYPLNKLRKRHPEVYSREKDKYAGREGLLDEPIPQLDCLWNDVIHCSPIQPAKIRAELANAGFVYRRAQWFKVDVCKAGMNRGNTVIFTFCSNKADLLGMSSKDFDTFDPTTLDALNTIPPETIAYFSRMKARNKIPFYFMYIPHVLFKGRLEIDALEVVWD